MVSGVKKTKVPVKGELLVINRLLDKSYFLNVAVLIANQLVELLAIPCTAAHVAVGSVSDRFICVVCSTVSDPPESDMCFDKTRSGDNALAMLLYSALPVFSVLPAAIT